VLPNASMNNKSLFFSALALKTVLVLRLV